MLYSDRTIKTKYYLLSKLKTKEKINIVNNNEKKELTKIKIIKKN